MYEQFKKKHTDNCPDDAVEAFRVALRQQVNHFIDYTQQNYSPKISEYLITPVIAYLDEHIRITLQPHNLRWDGFQNEFLQRNDLGEYFFTLADEIIRDNLYPAEVYASFYFALKLGFCGRYYANNKAPIKLYQRHIKRELKDLLINQLDTKMLAHHDKGNQAASDTQADDKKTKLFRNKSVHYWLIKQKMKYLGLLAVAAPVVIYIYTLMTR